MDPVCLRPGTAATSFAPSSVLPGEPGSLVGIVSVRVQEPTVYQEFLHEFAVPDRRIHLAVRPQGGGST
jgi:hypothetical protein